MAFTNRIRLPFKITRPQFPEDRSVYRKANGETKILSVVVKKTYEGETDWWPEKWHQRLAIALGHDNITIEGDKYLGGVAKDGDYEINWETFLDYPTAKAKFSVQVTPFDNTNSNCQTCEEAVQLSLEDDTFPDSLEEDQTYEINVSGNDNICCYPAVFSITTFDADYIETAVIDQFGILTIHTGSSFVSANGLKLVTYRVTCPNGGYDEADVYGDLSGSIEGCLAPSAIVVSGITTTFAMIDFTASPSTPDHYLWRLYKVSAPGVIVQSGDVSGTSFLLSGLTAGTEYIIYIRSQCESGDDDGTASNFIDDTFTTAPQTVLCGTYSLNYGDPYAPHLQTITINYLDCTGTYQNIFVPNGAQRVICAMQTSPGVPVHISSYPPYFNYTYDGEC